MIHVTPAAEAQKRKSFDVAFDLLATGPQCMMAKMHYRVGNQVPWHSHPNEQIGYLLFCRTRVRTRDDARELGPGDSYVIPAGVEHSIEILEDTDELQVFAPPRPEWFR